MSSSNDFDTVIKNALSRFFGKGPEDERQETADPGTLSGPAADLASITPARALVIAALIGDVLSVDSILIDKNQLVEVVLSGSLKRKTQLETVMNQIGKMPFDDVMRTIVGRLF